MSRICESFRLIIQKLLECSASSFCENIFQFRDDRFFKTKKQKNSKIRKKSEKIHICIRTN